MKVFNDFILTEYNGYKLPATCSSAYFPFNDEDIKTFFSKNLPFIILGTGQNVILSKKHYSERFLIFKDCFNSIDIINKNTILVQSGALMKDLSLFAEKHSLSGLEIFYDIPSSLGGAIFMNAGIKGNEIKDVLRKVNCFDLHTNSIIQFDVEDLEFNYRYSSFQDKSNYIILSAELALNNGVQSAIRQKMEEIRTLRWNKQPRSFPNAGSVFKRPNGHYAGDLIERCGLKGKTIGGAKISEKHAGFIINTGNATGEDIIALINCVVLEVDKKFGVKLELEQRII